MSFFYRHDPLKDLGEIVLKSAYATFPYLRPENVALSWLIYDDPVIVNTGGALSSAQFWNHPIRGYSFRGSERIYPASLVKLFYLVAAFEWLQAGMISDSSELQRALKDMIVDSSNDATSFVVDILTGTTSGPDLPTGPMETWQYQRNIVNRYYQSLGWPELEQININQKTWSDGPYGRERASVGELRDNRNMLTAEAIARLFHAIVGGVAVSSFFCETMLSLLNRDLKNIPTDEDENQVTGFLGQNINPDSQYWSKAGWTSQVRHDVAYIESPGVQPYLLVVLSEGINEQELLPFISEQFSLLMQNLPEWQR
jgi:beta-lactamase class A